MSKPVLVIDAGTSHAQAMIIDVDGQVLGRAVNGYKLHYPAPGLVEADPEELWNITHQTVARALDDAKLSAADLSVIGLTGQRATIIIWERRTGLPLGPAIIWQDLRGANRAQELLAQGFFTVETLTPAAKLEAALRNIPNGFQRVKQGELAWGNVDSFLLFRLTGGAVHATDPSHACTTGYYNYFEEWGWNQELIAAQNLDLSMFPQVVDSAGLVGSTSRQIFGAEVPIGAIIADQQSAAYAHGCLHPGQGKVTYGTSATFNVNTGQEMKLAKGAYPLVLWHRHLDKAYCLEGMVYTAGAVFSWLTDIGLIDHPAASAGIVAGLEDAHGVHFLPAFQGLGTPYGIPERRASFYHLTLGVTRAHLVRAAMEGVAFRVREMLDQVYLDSGLAQPETLWVDGGASENDALMQIQADVLGRPVERLAWIEATTLGAAFMAGETCGVWPPLVPNRMRRADRVFEPRWSEEKREERFTLWRQACGL